MSDRCYENVVGLQVTDEEGYRRYREAMTPLLEACGGGFRYDFRVAEVLRSETEAPINRVFLIHFPSVAAKEAFFADPRYLEARAAHFVPSVGAVTILAEYER